MSSEIFEINYQTLRASPFAQSDILSAISTSHCDEQRVHARYITSIMPEDVARELSAGFLFGRNRKLHLDRN